MDWQVFTTISVGILTPIIAVIVDRYFKDRPKLICHYGHVSSFILKPEDNPQLTSNTTIHTHSMVLKNAGRKSAKDVRIGHFYFPKNYNIWPPTEHKINKILDSGDEIVIPIMVPQSQITISYLYEQSITWDKIHSYVKSDDGYAKGVGTLTVISRPKWQFNAILAFGTLGLITFCYWGWILFQKFILPYFGSAE